jgi:CheY-like chemotaxis protein
VTVASREHPVRVVVIEDSVDIRALVAFGLSRAGMDVVGEAGDGSAGVEVVREERPDVVLLDLAMPIMDGVEALPLIRELVPVRRSSSSRRLMFRSLTVCSGPVRTATW